MASASKPSKNQPVDDDRAHLQMPAREGQALDTRSDLVAIG